MTEEEYYKQLRGLDAGFFYAPFVPLTMTSAMPTNAPINILSSYGSGLLVSNPEKYYGIKTKDIV